MYKISTSSVKQITSVTTSNYCLLKNSVLLGIDIIVVSSNFTFKRFGLYTEAIKRFGLYSEATVIDDGL